MASVGTRMIRSRPKPRNCNAENTEVCASSPASTRIGGAPNRPSASMSQPTRRRTSPRAAARQVKLASVAPVAKPTELSRGRSSSSRSQRAAASSQAAADGVGVWPPAFCPQALVSQSAAMPTGWEAPITQPKKRGPAMALSPGSARRTSSSITAAPSLSSSGNGAAKTSRISAKLLAGRCGRAARERRKAKACSTARSSRRSWPSFQAFGTDDTSLMGSLSDQPAAELVTASAASTARRSSAVSAAWGGTGSPTG